MGFLGKIKQFFGIGTVKVNVTVPAAFSVDDPSISGTVELVAKSDQEIVSVEVKFEEKWSTGRGDDKTEKTFDLGVQKFPGFTMKAGETKKIDYTVPFTYSKSDNDRMAEKGGVVGGLGKLSKFADGEKSTFHVVATCDIKGATFDPNDVKEVKKK
ncbi:MAG: sporulation protein [Bacteroidia bacterium]|nr:sporulation protein [Bacteroidia bacterium]